MVRSMAVIALGAALGANLRYLITLWVAQHLGASFPYATLAINSTGSLLLGLVYTLLPASSAGQLSLLRLFLGVGLLGGYTTFSSFSYETYQLAERGNLLGAALYVVASVSASLLGALAGVWLGARS